MQAPGLRGDGLDMGPNAGNPNRSNRFAVSFDSMNLARIDLNLLCAFDALFAEKSVSRAERRMGIGQPGMSDALRRLRKLFGDDLFVRAMGAMQPTPRARAIALEIGPLLVRMQAVMGENMAFAPGDSTKKFAVAATDYTAAVLLPPLVAALQREAPNVDLRVVDYTKDALGGMLDRGEIDLALGVFPNPPQHLVKSKLFKERFVGVIRAGHPALRDGAVDLDTFAALSHALISVRRDERGLVDAALAARGLRRRIALVLPYMLILPKILAANDLVATLPERAARRIDDGTLHIFKLPMAMDPWAVEMLWSPAARADKATAWLRKLIAATAKTL